ncbi:MAG TPA: hypothetical protein V6C64_01740 [Microcoleaceae cyanobacterium]|jgi:hypothetical protein
MEQNLPPSGEERQFQTVSGAAVDGAPIAYVIVLAAVVTALSFIPFSVVLATGGGMPLSQSILPLLGWLLGPIAGALASGIGALIGIFLAPYTAGGIPALTIGGAMLTSFAAGTMVVSGSRRKYWYLGLTILFVLLFCLYAYQAIGRNGITLNTFMLGSFVDWSGLLLFVLPTRQLIARWINSANVGLVAIGLFMGTWTISGVGHLSAASIAYLIFNWPQEIWVTLIPIIPVENLIRCTAGTVIGTGVISGLRAIKLVKPKHALY